MNSIQALEVSPGGKVTVDVHGVMALVVKADSFTESRRVRQKHHTVEVAAKAVDFGLPVFGAPMDDCRRELAEPSLK